MGLSISNLKGIVKKNLRKQRKSQRHKKLSKLKEYLKSTESKHASSPSRGKSPVSEFKLEFKPKVSQSDSVNVLLKRLNNLDQRTLTGMENSGFAPENQEGNRRLSFMRLPEFKESSHSTDNFKTIRRAGRDLSE